MNPPASVVAPTFPTGIALKSEKVSEFLVPWTAEVGLRPPGWRAWPVSPFLSLGPLNGQITHNQEEARSG